MEPLQIIIVVFALFAWSRALLRFKDRKISTKEFAFWTLVWGAAIVAMVNPGTTFVFANFFGIKRGADFVVYTSIIVLFYLLFRLYVKIDAMERNLTKIVSEISIKRKK